MKTRSRFKVIIEDETRLENLSVISMSATKWIVIVAAVILFIMALGAYIVFLSPLRQMFPGFLKDSERAATEVQIMRLDSLRLAFETNVAFIENIRNVLNPKSGSSDSLSAPKLIHPLSTDSLLPTSVEEQRFAAMMREKDKYNVSIVAPLAAESMMFSPVNEESVISIASRRSNKAEIILTPHAPISTIADGTVISVSQSLRDGGSVIIIQHPKGFLSRLSRLGTILVEPGDNVTGGQVIALSNRGNARKGEIVNLELWHNGSPLIPFDYVGDRSMGHFNDLTVDNEEYTN